MKFTITYPMHSHPYHPDFASGAGVATLAAACEKAGFDGFGFTDHPAPTQRWLDAGGHDSLDPFVAMAFAAAHTSTIRLIPNIVVLPYRNPFVVAKAGATLDRLSEGRFTLAVGVGYLRKEFIAVGVDYEERADLFDEALEVIDAIWTGDDVSYEEGISPPTASPPTRGRSVVRGRRSGSAGTPVRPVSASSTAARAGVRSRRRRRWPRPRRRRRWIRSRRSGPRSVTFAAGARPRAGIPQRSTSPSPTPRVVAPARTTSTPTPRWRGWKRLRHLV